MLKVKHKKKLKAARANQFVIYKGTLIRLIADFSIAKMEARQQKMTYSNC